MTHPEKSARGGWTWSTGERGINRVRVFTHPKSGRLFLEWAETDAMGVRTVRKSSLGHAMQSQAKREAIAKAAELAVQQPKNGTVTLGRLFESYERDVTPRKGIRTREHDRAASRLFLAFWGGSRDVMSLGHRDWQAFIDARRAGSLRPSGKDPKPVGNRAIEHDLRFLLSVLRWAKLGRLIPEVPLQGLPLPKVKSPKRPVMSAEDFSAILSVADRVHPLTRLALVLAGETGHRIGAIRRLRWSDFDFEAGTILWREENDKTGTAHRTPLSAGLRAELTGHRGIGQALVFPGKSGAPITREAFRHWWDRCEELAGLKPEPGRGWHSLRRRFATDRMHHPLKVVQALGGWKTPHVLLNCYQQPSIDDQRAALEAPRNQKHG